MLIHMREQAAVPDARSAAVPDARSAAVPDARSAACQMHVPDARAAAYQMHVPDAREAAVPDERAAAVPDACARRTCGCCATYQTHVRLDIMGWWGRLLYQMLPQGIADKLRQGERVEAISYPAVTILFRRHIILYVIILYVIILYYILFIYIMCVRDTLNPKAALQQKRAAVTE